MQRLVEEQVEEASTTTLEEKKRRLEDLSEEFESIAGTLNVALPRTIEASRADEPDTGTEDAGSETERLNLFTPNENLNAFTVPKLESEFDQGIEASKDKVIGEEASTTSSRTFIKQLYRATIRAMAPTEMMGNQQIEDHKMTGITAATNAQGGDPSEAIANSGTESLPSGIDGVDQPIRKLVVET